MAGDFLPILQQFGIKWGCKDAEILARAGAGQFSGSLQAAGLIRMEGALYGMLHLII